MYVYVYTYTQAYMRACVCMCVCVHVYTHIYIYISNLHTCRCMCVCESGGGGPYTFLPTRMPGLTSRDRAPERTCSTPAENPRPGIGVNYAPGWRQKGIRTAWEPVPPPPNITWVAPT